MQDNPKKHHEVTCWNCDGHGLVSSWSYGVKEPDECKICGGKGTVTFYPDSGTYVQYPGGKLLGRARHAA